MQLKEGATMHLYLFAHLYIKEQNKKKELKYISSALKIPIIKHLNHSHQEKLNFTALIQMNTGKVRFHFLRYKIRNKVTGPVIR